MDTIGHGLDGAPGGATALTRDATQSQTAVGPSAQPTGRAAQEGRRGPLVSVVVPCFRGGPLLEQAVASVQAQTYSRWELILVDNGVPGGLDDVCPDERARVVREPRPGIAWARNRGILVARGELVALLDEDDLWHPDKLTRQVRALSEAPAAVLCHSDYRVVDREGRPLGVSSSWLPGSYEEMLRKGGGILASTVVVCRDRLAASGLHDPRRRSADDLDLFLRLLREDAQLVVLKEQLADYRWHSLNTSKRYRIQCRELRGILRDAGRLARMEGRWDRFLLATRGELATRKGFGEVAADRAARELCEGEVVKALSDLAFGLWLSPLAAAVLWKRWRVLAAGRPRTRSGGPGGVASAQTEVGG
ncbi:MAG: glycosyltransferase family 2 protein [Acidimicrobiales bacterium]